MKKSMIISAAALVLAGSMVLAGFASVDEAKAGENASAKANTEAAELTEENTGAWEANSGSLSLKKNKYAKKAFSKATSKVYGYTYKPVALIGTQVVAGTNYCFLVRGQVTAPKTKPTYQLVYVYENLDGKARITKTKRLAKGYSVNTGSPSLKKHKTVRKAFAKATRDLLGADYEPVCYMGYKKVKSGMNYQVLCRMTVVVPDAEPEFDIVTIHRNKKGNRASVKKITEIKLGK